MASIYDIDKMQRVSVEDLLTKFTPMEPLKWLWEFSLQLLALKHPAALPQPEGGKTPRKAYLVSLLLAIFRNAAMGRRFFDSLPPATRAVLARLTWENLVNLAELEKAVGCQVAMANPNQGRAFLEPLILAPGQFFVEFIPTRDASWSYYSERGRPNKEKYNAFLPDPLRRAFKGFVPPPSGYELQPVAELPASAQARYCCFQKAVGDLRLVAEFIAQGHLKYTKAERVSLSSLRTLHQMTGGPEFFEKPANPDLELLRTRLLAGGVAFAGEKEREKLLANPGAAGPVRELIEKVLANASLLHEELLGHLRQTRDNWSYYAAPAVKNLALFFGKLPGGEWISFDNIRSYHLLREEVPSIFAQRARGMQAAAMQQGDEWSRSIYIHDDNEFELLSEPLLKGYAFLLAAFGLAEIAYSSPKHPTYHRSGHAYLSPFDGLGYVRLTPLGEFVFRQKDTFEMTGDASPAASKIVLDEARLLATCRNADQLTELALGQFFENLAPGRYRMTPKSLLGGCRSREDVEGRIRLFRRVVSPSPPAVWEAFFQQTLARIAPLSLEPEYLVLKVSNDDEIRRILATDPVLREIVLKVEGLRIAVRHPDLKKLAKRLEQFGYLSSLSRLGQEPE